MANIDNLWDDPVESEAAPHLVANPMTSSEDPLFLQSDSDNEGGKDAARSRLSKAPDDIGALFDVDDDESGQLSNVSYEQLRKDALSGRKVPDDGPSGGENQGIEEDPPKEGSAVKSKKGEDGDTAGTKRTIPKLDEGLLLSEKGIRALIKDTKRWRPKGKGHEASSLSVASNASLWLIRSVRSRTSVVSFGRTNTGPTRCTLGIHSVILLKGSRN